MRAALLALALAGCGAPSPPLHATPDAGVADAAPAVASGADGSAIASLDTIAARGASDAPLMREVLRVDRVAPRSPDVKADRDLCVRALFAAGAPVRVAFVERGGDGRGEATTAASGAVPPRGPICIKKGEAVHLVVEGEAVVRAVVFAAP